MVHPEETFHPWRLIGREYESPPLFHKVYVCVCPPMSPLGGLEKMEWLPFTSGTQCPQMDNCFFSTSHSNRHQLWPSRCVKMPWFLLHNCVELGAKEHAILGGGWFPAATSPPASWPKALCVRYCLNMGSAQQFKKAGWVRNCKPHISRCQWFASNTSGIHLCDASSPSPN